MGSVVHAVTEASSMEGAVEAMAQLPACFNASLLPAVSHPPGHNAALLVLRQASLHPELL